MKARKTNIFATFGLHILGFSLCILPPAICTLSYFPVWRASGLESCIAGGTALLLALCILPLYKFIRHKISSYPSYMMWLLLFLVFFALSRIAEQMTVISLVGFISNLLGAVCFYLGGRRQVKCHEGK